MFYMILAVAIFAITYILIMTEWINKMTAALLGGFLVVVTGAISQGKAYQAVDWNVIFLLIGMMMVMGVLKQTGVFQYIAIKVAKFARAKPLYILLLMFSVTAFVSAFLDNVTTVMILVPIALLIASELKITPIPYIITMAIASNIGGTATVIGDPPNVMIGSATQYSFMDFIYHLTPAIVIVMVFSLVLTWLFFHKGMTVTNENRARLMNYKEDNLIADKKLLRRSLIVVTLMMLAFLFQDKLHLAISTIAMVSGLILLLFSNRKRVENFLAHDIDWATIFFFIGLFIIVGSLIETGFINLVSNKIMAVSSGDLRKTSVIILWFSGIFSAFIDNVPFVATMIPLIKSIGTHFPAQAMHPVWWALSLGACLGGNGTLIGASANIVSVGLAHKNGFSISFLDFTKIGVFYMLLSLVLSTAYILVRYF